MPRKPRELVAGGVYHVFARGNRREPVFLSDDDRRQYLAIWGSVVEELGWHCLAYCLMDNHVHHLVETPETNLSEGVQLAHGSYARYFNETYGKVGHAFQGRFGSTRAKTSGALWYFASYIVLNPVRAGMCTLPAEYVWSSHRAVVGECEPPAWLDVERLLSKYESAEPLERYVRLTDAVRVMGAAGFEPATSRV